MIAIIIICALIILAIVYSVLTYKKLVSLKLKIRGAWKALDASLNERFSLLPKFIILLQRIAPSEKDTLQKGVDAICYANGAKNKANKIAADRVLRDVIDDLFNIYKNYEADKQDSERLYPSLYILTEKISSLRQGYNLAVKEYNDKVLKYPSKIIALLSHHKADIYYEVDVSKKEEIDSL